MNRTGGSLLMQIVNATADGFAMWVQNRSNRKNK